MKLLCLAAPCLYRAVPYLPAIVRAPVPCTYRYLDVPGQLTLLQQVAMHAMQDKLMQHMLALGGEGESAGVFADAVYVSISMVCVRIYVCVRACVCVCACVCARQELWRQPWVSGITMVRAAAVPVIRFTAAPYAFSEADSQVMPYCTAK